MQLSKFSRWWVSFFSSLKKEAFAEKKPVNGEKIYHKLLVKVEELENLMKEESLKNERLKTCFLNNIYHEIRTPMNSIVGFAQLLKDEYLTDDKRDMFMEKISKSSEDFLQLLDHLLEASLIESGNINLQKTECHLPQLMNELHAYFNIQKHILDKNNIALLKNPDKNYPNLSIFADRNRLYQVFSNLISNALKFTRRGVVEFGYKVLNPSQVMFFVKDSGTGINSDLDPVLFESFIKTEYCDGKENRGLGLGLSISKGIVNKMGGKIWVENNNNFGGATFKFSIPLERIHTSLKNGDKEKSQGKRRLA
ncbi:MAG: HAMP domain-containing histidine kinase, partial [Bacteroidales bacterium]|nr:HAMP domain-containing histidine kinase [Bacteroidales bacterium]